MRGAARRWTHTILAVVVLIPLAGCFQWNGWMDATPPPPVPVHERAADDARQKLLRVEQSIEPRPPHDVYRYARSAARVDGTEVMRIGGARLDGKDGTSLVIRVRGVAPVHDDQGRATGEILTLPFCFQLSWGTDVTDDRVDEVPCPGTSPVRVSTDPALPGDVDETLHARLPTGAAATEAAVRAVVDGIALEPGVRRDVATAGGTVGVALRASQYDCVLARVVGAKVEVWRPARVQLAPGELSCTADTAAAGMGRRPPH
ncbi:hypothetical protein NCC78_15320 [Micromonospora phytophila]|uniref:hypothetical protein n=1 Tax=Micromonospora phytophila TaxID=709888 RepID=UPI00202E19B8|nr:hypothetical protein [Micromonospora phytophila]MCM0676050.1 hypothetical protein [Micromonospora phytophila]